MSNYKKIRNIMELIFPGRCFVCGSYLFNKINSFYPVCGACMKKIKVLSGIRCNICGIPLISEYDVCTRCRNRTYHFNSHNSLFEYSGIIKDLIYLYKFKGRKRLANLFALLLGKELSNKYRNYPVIPVPSILNKRKNKKILKGSSLNEILIKLKNINGVKIYNCLKRLGNTPQKGLDFKNRLKNIKGQVVLLENKLPDSKHVLLLDDIFTTGATADECARVLLTSGIEKVEVLTIAID